MLLKRSSSFMVRCDEKILPKHTQESAIINRAKGETAERKSSAAAESFQLKACRVEYKKIDNIYCELH